MGVSPGFSSMPDMAMASLNAANDSRLVVQAPHEPPVWHRGDPLRYQSDVTQMRDMDSAEYTDRIYKERLLKDYGGTGHPLDPFLPGNEEFRLPPQGAPTPNHKFMDARRDRAKGPPRPGRSLLDGRSKK